MSDIDPTFLPPDWMSGYDHEQHKVMTEHGLLDFFENKFREETARFREWETEAELPEEVRVFREILQKEQNRNHKVRVQDIGVGCEYHNENVAANSATEISTGRELFVGVSAAVATNITVFDQGNAGGVGAFIGVWATGPAAPPVWFDRGIKCRNGIFIVSSVATSVTVFFRELET